MKIGIDEIAIDVKGKKLTVIGTVDPVSVVSKLRKKNWPTDIISLGPVKEPEKKEEPEKEEPKKEEPKKEEPKKEEAKKDEKETEPEVLVGPVMPYKAYYPPSITAWTRTQTPVLSAKMGKISKGEILFLFS